MWGRRPASMSDASPIRATEYDTSSKCEMLGMLRSSHWFLLLLLPLNETHKLCSSPTARPALLSLVLLPVRVITSLLPCTHTHTYTCMCKQGTALQPDRLHAYRNTVIHTSSLPYPSHSPASLLPSRTRDTVIHTSSLPCPCHSPASLLPSRTALPQTPAPARPGAGPAQTRLQRLQQQAWQR